MTKKTIIPIHRTWGGFALDCVCGARIFRYTRAATVKAKTEHLKREHYPRWQKGRIR